MKITFDPRKRLKTLSERGIDFAVDAEKVFSGKVARFVSNRRDYSEKREVTIGWLGSRMVVVVWTQRGIARHIISMRFCHAKERDKFLPEFDP